MSAPMADMSKAVIGVLTRYGKTLHDIPDDALDEFHRILTAYTHMISR